MADRTDHLRAITWSGVAGAIALVVPAAAGAGFRVAPGSVPLVIAFAGAALLLWRRPPASFGAQAGLVAFIEGMMLFMAIGVIGATASYVVMATGAGYADALLDRWDRAIGFDWRATHAFVMRRSWLHGTLVAAYATCFWMPILLLVLLWRAGAIAHMYRFLLAHGIALVVTIAIFLLLPARSAFGFYLGTGGKAGAMAAHYEPAMDGLRDGSLRMLHLDGMAGIITFPSFHAVMAILFVWGAWPGAGRWRWPIVIVNAAMWLSAVPIGSHYLVDVIAGSAVAVGAIQVAKRIGGVPASRAALVVAAA